MFLNTGFLVLISIAIALNVFTSDIPSAPASTHLTATSTMFSAFGESFTITGLLDTAFISFTTSNAGPHCIPNAIPPDLTLGQDMLSSIISISVSFKSFIPST